jgi:Sensors of blue-light using FAD
MPLLRSIVYVSSANWIMTAPELEALLVEARRLNLEADVTGVLLYDDGSFMQCFEGPEEGVRLAYERIRQSRKHRGLFELVNEVVAARSFQAWEMGFKKVNASEFLTLSTAQWRRQVAQAEPLLNDSPGMFLLKHFWTQSPGH